MVHASPILRSHVIIFLIKHNPSSPEGYTYQLPFVFIIKNNFSDVKYLFQKKLHFKCFFLYLFSSFFFISKRNKFWIQRSNLYNYIKIIKFHYFTCNYIQFFFNKFNYCIFQNFNACLIYFQFTNHIKSQKI